jgi:hypothetical protein
MDEFAKELEDRFERNEQAFEAGKISEEWYKKNAIFYSSIAKLVDKHQQSLLALADHQNERFVFSVQHELERHGLKINVLGSGLTYIVPLETKDRIWRELHKEKLLTAFAVKLDYGDDGVEFLEEMHSLGRIQKKVNPAGSYYKLKKED